MYTLQNVSKTYEQFKAVDDISLKIQKGETFVLLGTSGSGKTTTLKMLNKLIEPDKGKILFKDQPINELSEEVLRRKTGYVIQDIGLFPHYTVSENIAVVPRLMKWDAASINKRIDELLEKLHLPLDLKLKLPNQLSGGQQQRVGIARAMAAKPVVILMDEAFGALDPITRESIRNDFMTLDELKDTTIVMVTHDMQEAFAMADRICLMDHGKIIQMDEPKTLLLKPENDFVREFFLPERFQLLLMTIKIKDFFRDIKQVQPGANQEVLTLPIEEPIQTIMKKMTQYDSPEIIRIVERDQEWFTTDSNIISAYQHFLKHLK